MNRSLRVYDQDPDLVAGDSAGNALEVHGGRLLVTVVGELTRSACARSSRESPSGAISEAGTDSMLCSVYSLTTTVIGNG